MIGFDFGVLFSDFMVNSIEELATARYVRFVDTGYAARAITRSAIATSSRFYVGDEGNDQRPLDGYGIANFRSVYRVSDNIEIFARIDNLLNNHYSTFGVLAELEVFLSEVPDAQDQRFVSPGTARSGFVGLRIGL